jgi:hypothetical protein
VKENAHGRRAVGEIMFAMAACKKKRQFAFFTGASATKTPTREKTGLVKVNATETKDLAKSECQVSSNNRLLAAFAPSVLK